MYDIFNFLTHINIMAIYVYTMYQYLTILLQCLSIYIFAMHFHYHKVLSIIANYLLIFRSQKSMHQLSSTIGFCEGKS